MKEAFRLLNKSIIRVETPDIDFEEDQQLLDGKERERESERGEGRERKRERERGEREREMSVAAGEGEDGMVNGVNGLNGDLGIDEGHLDKPMAPEKPAATAAPSTRKIRVTYEEYKSISNLLILRLRQMEETSPGEPATIPLQKSQNGSLSPENSYTA